MPGSHLFNLGLFQKNFGGNNRIAGVSINLGSTKGRGSSTRMFNYCNQHSANPSECINQFINVAPPPPTPTILVYNTSQGPSFDWSGVTFTLNTSLSNYSYTAITNAIPATQLPQARTNLIGVTIPASVTTIGQNAFKGCSALTSVTIPASVTSIGQSVFQDCFGLTSINVDTDNTSYSSVDGVLFNKLQTTLVEFPPGKSTSYTIPNSVTTIGTNAFINVNGLTSVTIGSSVTIIGTNAFESCNNLSSVTFAPTSTLISIGHQAFRTCPALTSITLPISVTTIGTNSFQNCSGLTSIIIPNLVTSIGSNAFNSCSGLTSIIIPNSVTTIGSNAFTSSGLSTVYISNATASALGPWTSPGTVSSPDFYGAPNTVTLTPPDTTILEYNTSQVSPFTWGSVTFTINTNLPNFSYTAITTSIPSSTVPDYANLISVIFGNNVTTIGSAVFDSCTNLTSVTLPTNLSFTSISDFVFINCSGLTSITIPNSVTIINDSAFEGCSSLSSFIIPNSVTPIGIGVFDSCTGLTSVTIGTSVTSIGSNAFQNCSSLTSITIPNSVTFIDTNAFIISGLSTVHIASTPKTISTIVFTAGTTVSFFGKANVSIVYP